MTIEYKAFSGGKEIDSFYSGGKEIQEIWGGDTLLWQKSTGINFPQVRKMIHCGKRTVVFFQDTIVTLKSTYPYYDKIFDRPNFDPRYVDYHLYTSVFNEELYILPIRYEPNNSKKTIALYLDGFYIFSNEMELRKKYDGIDLEIDIGNVDISASSGKYVRPFKVWVENERFHLALVYYKSTFVGNGDYVYEPIWFKNLVFEKGELIEQQNKFTSSNKQFFNYGDDHNYDPNTVVIPYNNGYGLAFDEISNEDRLLEVSVNSSDMKRVYGSSDDNISQDSYFAGCHNGMFLWLGFIDRKAGIHEFINNSFVFKCSCEFYPKWGVVPYNGQFLYAQEIYAGTKLYAVIKISKDGSINKDDFVVYKTREPIFGIRTGLVLENGFVYIFYSVVSDGRLVMRMDFFRI